MPACLVIHTHNRPSAWDQQCAGGKDVVGFSYQEEKNIYFSMAIKEIFSLQFLAANLALAGFPLTNALGESMPSRH